jgi:hypothetical protein
MTQKQIKEFRENLNKHQSETKDTIREIYELKKNYTNYERRVEHRFGKPQKKESNRNLGNKKSLQSKNTVEAHSSRLEQVEDRISEFQD